MSRKKSDPDQRPAEGTFEPAGETPALDAAAVAAGEVVVVEGRVVLFYDGTAERMNFWVVRTGGDWVCVQATKGQSTAPLDTDVAEQLLASKKGFSVAVDREIAGSQPERTEPAQE